MRFSPLSIGVLAASFALISSACATTQREVRVQTDAALAAQVAHPKTYAFGSREEAPTRYRSSPTSAEASRHMEAMIDADLRAKGYVPADSIANADLVWMFAAGRRERELHQQGVEQDTVGPDQDPEEEYVEGAIMIDALDGRTGARVWHGFGRTEVEPSNVDDALLRKTVDKVMARFPTATR